MAELSQGLGYGILLGVGLAFACTMIAITHALKRYQRERMTAEEFGTAGRSVQSGLIASAVISSWSWPTSLLTSTAQVFGNSYNGRGTSGTVGGGVFYASGCGSVVYIMTLLAMEVKRKAPGCHTFLELVRVRYGKAAHGVFMFFAIAMNILITLQLLIGAGTVFNYLSGMHEVAAIFLSVLPVGVYVVLGGLRSVLVTDYLHTCVMLLLALVFAFNCYTTNEYIGSPGRLYDILKDLPIYIEGNKNGSILTMRSDTGAIFLLYAISSCIPLIVLDQGYWNKAIAASPRSVLPGYIMGGLSWYAMPFGLATCLGLAGRALENTSAWKGPKLTPKDVSAGLVLPASATALMGHNGAVCAFLLILMSITSTASAEFVSVSSIWTYDIYQAYINPRASNKQLMLMTHFAVIIFVLVMCGFAVGLYYAGVDIGWLFDFNAVVCGGAVVPAILPLYWSGMNRQSAIWSPILGLITGIACWIGVTAGLNHDQITLDTTGQYWPGIAAMLIAMGSPIIYIAIFQLIFGNENYDFENLRRFGEIREEPEAVRTESLDEKQTQIEKINETVQIQSWIDQEQYLNKYIKPSRLLCLVIFLALMIVWPMPMYGSNYIFSKDFFTGWIVVTFIWLWVALILVGVLPLWQGRNALAYTARAIWWDISGQSHKVNEWRHEHPEQLHQEFLAVGAENTSSTL